jgi:ATP-dependent Clp protease ATP-binding subunit ClpB
MTSNIGSQIIRENLEKVNDSNRDEIINKTREQVFDLLRKTIRPEFLNRVDEIIMFQPLTKEEIFKVVELQIGIIKQMLAKNDLKLTVTKKAMKHIANIGFDPQFGARPIKRVIQKKLLNELSKLILEGKVDKNSEIVVDEKDGTLIFKNS